MIYGSWRVVVLILKLSDCRPIGNTEAFSFLFVLIIAWSMRIKPTSPLFSNASIACSYVKDNRSAILRIPKPDFAQAIGLCEYNNNSHFYILLISHLFLQIS